MQHPAFFSHYMNRQERVFFSRQLNESGLETTMPRRKEHDVETVPEKAAQTLAWIEKEFNATKKVKTTGVVGYETHLEPNPAHGVCEGTDYPSTPDGQQIIVEKAVYGEVEKEVRDEKRAQTAASLLVDMVLQDETLIGKADSIMGCDDLFQTHWQKIHDRALEKKTRRIAAWKLGRRPVQVAVIRIIRLLSSLFAVVRGFAFVTVGVAFYAWLIYALWPRSSLGRWIASKAAETFRFLGTFFQGW